MDRRAGRTLPDGPARRPDEILHGTVLEKRGLERALPHLAPKLVRRARGAGARRDRAGRAARSSWGGRSPGIGPAVRGREFHRRHPTPWVAGAVATQSVTVTFANSAGQSLTGRATVAEIAKRADCTTGYVYNIRTDWMLANARKAAPQMRQLNKQMDQAIAPKAFSHDWQPKWWQMLLMSDFGFIVVYIFLVLGLSL